MSSDMSDMSDMSELEKLVPAKEKKNSPEDIQEIKNSVDAMEEVVSELQRESGLSERDKVLVEALRTIAKGLRKVVNKEIEPE